MLTHLTWFAHAALQLGIEAVDALRDDTDPPPLATACGAVLYPAHCVNLFDVRCFLIGERVPLPTCPRCAVLWDQAIEAKK